jgi:putative glycosyltransferase (TIGR04348 family)
MPLRIAIACPAPPASRQGNRVTALRWARILRRLGHRVRIAAAPDGPADLLIALHARRSAAVVERFRRRFPERPIVVALTGTDLYRDLGRSRSAARAVARADRLVTLQPLAARALPARLRPRVRVIHQSARVPRRWPRPARRTFDVCVLSHLRPVKDPLRAAAAARWLPAVSRVRVLHAGRALSPAMARAARAESRRNRRYRWLGERSPGAARTLLARSRVLVLSSRLEGGANVVGEAAVCGVPVLASRVDGNVGLLGAGYPGLFPTGDTETLARLLARVETDPRFRARLTRAVRRLAPRFDPRRETRTWQRLLAELAAAHRVRTATARSPARHAR